MSKKEVLYKLMVRRGYPKDFSGLICNELGTDFLCERMMHYIAGEKHSLEDVADEMISLKSFRDRLVEKHKAEYAQEKINELYNNLNEGIDEDEEDKD